MKQMYRQTMLSKEETKLIQKRTKQGKKICKTVIKSKQRIQDVKLQTKNKRKTKLKINEGAKDPINIEGD